RIWRHDHTLWKPDPTEITDRLGWLTVMDTKLEQVPDLEAFAKKAASDGLRTAVLCGMGGSSLAPEVFARMYGAADGALELVVLDTTHPAAVARVTEELPPDETLYVIASKAGPALGARQGDDRAARGDRVVRRLGRAADSRIDRQGGHGDPAGGR